MTMAGDSPLPVSLQRDVMIPMRDGVHLAANLYIPEGVGRYPGIFSFYPYLKDGYVGLEHEPHHRYFASRGYAVMQVDFRGTGASEGSNPYPFSLQERQDGYDIVEWIATQTWCTGDIGIWGISYGAITAYSIASTQPPHLRAIIPISGTTDNFEWLHRTHGCRGLLRGDVDFGTRMAASNLLPPVRQDPDGRWARLWAQRLEENRPWFLEWHSPSSETSWEDRKIPYERIDVPTFSLCSWNEGYEIPMFAVHEALDAPKRLMIGAWKHTLPDLSPTSPAGVVAEMDKWWDRWLKRVDNGVDSEPPVLMYTMEANTWRYEAEWPIARTSRNRLYVDGSNLTADVPEAEAVAPYTYDSTVGTGSIGMDAHRAHLDIPADQSFDDHSSLNFTTAPLEAPLEITGTPKAQVVVSASVEELTLVAKLCVVSADGSSRVISQGNANPARRDAHAAKIPLSPGERRLTTILMQPTSIVVAPGQRIRLCLAGADFPELWPTPQPYQMEVHGGPEGSFVELPTVPESSGAFPRPQLAAPRADLATPGRTTKHLDILHQHVGTRVVAFETRRISSHDVDVATTLEGDHHATVITDADRPWTTNLTADSSYELRRPAGVVTVRVKSVLTPYAVSAQAEVEIDHKPFFRRHWNEKVGDWIDV